MRGLRCQLFRWSRQIRSAAYRPRPYWQQSGVRARRLLADQFAAPQFELLGVAAQCMRFRKDLDDPAPVPATQRRRAPPLRPCSKPASAGGSIGKMQELPNWSRFVDLDGMGFRHGLSPVTASRARDMRTLTIWH